MIHAGLQEDRMSHPTPVALRPHHGYRSWTTSWWDDQKHRRTRRFGKEKAVTRTRAIALYQNWLANEYGTKDSVRNPESPDILTVDQFCDAYEQFAKGHYVKDGKPTGHIWGVIYGMKALRDMYVGRPLADLDYPKLVKLRDAMQTDADGEARAVKTVNGRLGCIKAALKWARGKDWITAVQLYDLMAVPAVRGARADAKQTDRIQPVADDLVQQTKRYLPPTLCDMIDVQLLGHMRPGEICMMRPCDIDLSDDVWVYTPESHKTEHLGGIRQIPLGSRAQAILKKYLDRKPTAYLFSPVQANRERAVAKAEKRKTPLSCGNRAGSNRKENPKVAPGDVYSVNSYRKAIRYAIIAARKAAKGAAVEAWAPNRLRHSAATKTREEFGYAASVDMLGHGAPATSQIYAEWSLERAKAFARKVG